MTTATVTSERLPFNSLNVQSMDEWESENYGLPSALYYYYLNTNMANFQDNATAVLGNCSAIKSVQFVPFISQTDLNATSIPYDTKRFGITESIKAELTTIPRVYRINALINEIKTLGQFTCYNPTKNIGGDRDWKNESRLYNYPYSFGMITDHLNPPLEIKYHLCKYNTNNIKCISTISDRCSYGIYVDNYKNDNGQLESLVSTDAHELPCSSSSYNQWVATNKNQVNQNVLNNSNQIFLQNANIRDNSNLNMVGSAIQGIGSLINGSLYGLSSSALGITSNLINAEYQINSNNLSLDNLVKSNMALEKDLKSTPNTIISMGSNIYYGLAKGNFQLDFYRFGLTEEYYKRLGDYFALFGYKQNKIMNINYRNRYYYNYIKTVGVNIKTDDNECIPRNHLEELKSIYNKGVTVWHIDREGVVVGDISKDNKEV